MELNKMELVYLWVEKYKNIKEQEFNFSPRFECEYKDGELTITPKEHIENFFDEKGKINITAIVGENGSGKSSVIKIILLLIFLKKYEIQILETKTINKEIRIALNYLIVLGDLESKDIYLLVYHDEKMKKISLLEAIKNISMNIEPIKTFEWKIEQSKISIKFKGKKVEELNNIDFFSIHFNYMLDTLYDGTQDSWIKQLYHKNDRYTTPILLEPRKNIGNEQIINLDNIEYINNQNFLRFYSEATNNESISFFKPDSINITLAKDYIPNSSLENEELQLLTVKRFCTSISHTVEEAVKESFIKYIKELYNNYEYKKINILYLSLKVLSLSESLFNTTNYALVKKEIGLLVNNTSNTTSYKKIENILDRLIDKDAPDYEVRKIQVCIDFNSNLEKMEPIIRDSIINDLDSGITKSIFDIKDILPYIPSWMSVKWLEGEKSFTSLSGGEKSIFTFLLNLMYQVQNINDKDEYNTINIFLDEVELGFHPQWQKKFLTYILEALKTVNKNNKTINIIFMTHSPFLLSDLPKENIIFLDTYKKEEDNQKVGNCKNVTKTTNINPFGANIHTLLSDGFFMDGGLMGEFAKGKIEEIKRFYEIIIKLQNKIKKERLIKLFLKKQIKFWQIQTIIGEPFLQKIVQNQLEEIELILLGRDEAIDNEIARLQALKVSSKNA